MGWSAYQELPIIFPENPEFSSVIAENYEDAGQWRIGAEFRASQHWALQLGYLFDETGQPVESMSPLLGDGDRTAYTGGLSYYTDRFRFDLGLEYVKTEARSTGGNSNDGFDGTYEGNSPLVHMSFTIKF
jgi:long-subunit fatty acid transport protein